jgi:site-specific recombinase XerD
MLTLPNHWPEHTLFATASGLRRFEMRDLRVEDVSQQANGKVNIHVKKGKGGKARDVVVLAGYEAAIFSVTTAARMCYNSAHPAAALKVLSLSL